MGNRSKLFTHYPFSKRILNYNDAIFNVETQEGSEILEGDEGVASIGDATMQHIQDLSSLERMAYDEFIHMPDGNIFRMEENTNYSDFEEVSLEAGETLASAVEKREKLLTEMEEKLASTAAIFYSADEAITPASRELAKKEATLLCNQISSLQDEIELLQARNSEDVMGRREDMVPYQDWEQFGGLSLKQWDLPPTPKPKMIYAGNSRQIFYDELGEDSPCSGWVSRVLMTLDRFEWIQIMTGEQVALHNREVKSKGVGAPILQNPDMPSHILTDGKSEFLLAEAYINTLFLSIGNVPAPTTFKISTYEVIKDLVLNLAEGKGTSPEDMVSDALQKLDRIHFSWYRTQVVQRTKREDPLFMSLCSLQKSVVENLKKGKNSISEVKRLGQELFEKGFVTQKEVRGEDGKMSIETSVEYPRRHHWKKYQEIKKMLGHVPEDGLPRVKPGSWAEHIRGVQQNIHERKKMAGKNSETVVELLTKIRSERDIALRAGSLRSFTVLATDLMLLQRTGKLTLNARERDIVWTAYNSAKQEISRALLAGKKSAKQSAKGEVASSG